MVEATPWPCSLGAQMPAWSGLRAADIHVVRCQPLRFPTWCRQLRSGERTRPVSGHLRRTGVRRPYPQAYPTAALAVPKLQLALELLLASRPVYQVFSLNRSGLESTSQAECAGLIPVIGSTSRLAARSNIVQLLKAYIASTES